MNLFFKFQLSIFFSNKKFYIYTNNVNIFSHFYEKRYGLFPIDENILSKNSVFLAFIFARENVWYKTEFESSRTLYDLRISFPNHLACRLDARWFGLPSLSSSKNSRVVFANPLPMDSKIPEHRGIAFVLLGSMRAMDIVRLSPVPKSSLVSTYSFLTIMDCARFRSDSKEAAANHLATALIEAPKI